MRLQTEFYKLPLKFDVERLVKEVSSFAESDWMAHPMSFRGNSSIPLISVNGEYNDEFSGPMAITPALKKCPYIQQVISSFNSVFGRSRLMRLGGGCEVPAHGDITYHWYNRVRIHVPIITFPDVTFYCNQKNVHMAAGEAWIFDSWKVHRVVNPTSMARIHLVADTAGSADFWEMVERSEKPLAPEASDNEEARFIPYRANAKPQILTERFNTQVVMSPGEVDALLLDLVDDIRANKESDPEIVGLFARAADRFRREWRTTWYLHAAERSGWSCYEVLIRQFLTSVSPRADALVLASNRAEAVITLKSRVLASALNTSVAPGAVAATPVPESRSATAEEKRKVGRNEPCPCGSGKKYKQCHG